MPARSSFLQISFSVCVLLFIRSNFFVGDGPLVEAVINTDFVTSVEKERGRGEGRPFTHLGLLALLTADHHSSRVVQWSVLGQHLTEQELTSWIEIRLRRIISAPRS